MAVLEGQNQELSGREASLLDSSNEAQVNSKPNITCTFRRLDFLGLVILELETSPNFPVWCRAIHEHESREVS